MARFGRLQQQPIKCWTTLCKKAVKTLRSTWWNRRGWMDFHQASKLFMSSNLIKLAPKHFLIFLICLDNSSSSAWMLGTGKVTDEGRRKICFGFVLHEIRLRKLFVLPFELFPFHWISFVFARVTNGGKFALQFI